MSETKYKYTYKKRLTVQVRDKEDIVIERTWKDNPYLWVNFTKPDINEIWYCPEGDGVDCHIRTADIISTKEEYLYIKDNTGEIDAKTPDEIAQAKDIYYSRS